MEHHHNTLIYEVSLTIENEIFEAYKAFLPDHILEIVKIDGFLSAELLQPLESTTEGNTSRLVVRYRVANKQVLDDYFNHHAPKLRHEVIAKFGDKFKAVRSTWSSLQSFHH